MGLAASQARLLTITARLADNELRSQTINNAKMRLATQSSQASDEYVSALNNAQLMFSNTDINGLARTQALTFNNLVSYSQYNNQYGLVNSAGLLLVNEQDAAIFEAHKNDLEGFLGEYGLRWDTTFFDDSTGKSKSASTELSRKLESFYGTGHIDNNSSRGYNFGDLFSGMTNEQLEKLYLNSLTEEASIERMNYEVYAKAFYNELENVYVNAVPEFRQDVLGDSLAPNEEAIVNELVSIAKSLPLEEGDKFIQNMLMHGYDSKYKPQAPAAYCLDVLAANGSLTADGVNRLTEFIMSLTDHTNTTGVQANEEAGIMDYSYSLSTSPSSKDADTYLAYNGSSTYTHGSSGNRNYNWDQNTINDNGNNSQYPNDVVLVKKTKDVNGNETGKYYTYNLCGLEIKIDEPQLSSDKTVTWETDGYDTEYTIKKLDGSSSRTVTERGDIQPSYDNETEYISGKTKIYDTDSVATQKQTGFRTYVEYGATDGNGGVYTNSSIDNINAYLSTKTANDFKDPARLKQIQIDLSKIMYSEYDDNQYGVGDGGKVTCMFRYIDGKIVRVPLDMTRNEAYETVLTDYFHAIFNTESYFDSLGYAANNPDRVGDFGALLQDYQLYDDNPSAGVGKLESLVINNPAYLMNFTSILEALGGSLVTRSGSDINYTIGSAAFKSVVDTYLADLMLDVLGEPKYAWIDENDPSSSQNSDAKAQWYSNLFNRMQRGYKVLENGLANSAEWIEYAFETGLVTMEQVDKSYNWVGLDYKTCANIYENSDTSDAVAKAEAKYNRAMNDIKQKDNMFDLQLKNIDTEHQSLQTEYDSVKTVMNKNIERTMKFDQSA